MTSNRERYKHLVSQYRVRRCSLDYYKANKQSLQDKYDLIIETGDPYPYEAHYYLLYNNTNLSDNDILLICDEGNLCYGGHVSGGTYIVHTD